MIHIIVSVRDVKSEAYGRPFFVPSIGVAIRSFDDEVNNAREDNILNKHYGDFALFKVGEFNDSDGSIVSENPPKVLIEGMQVKKQAEVHKISKV